MPRSFLGPRKIFVPYLTPSSTFVPSVTLRRVFHPATVNCAVKRRFCPCGPHHPSPSSPPGRRVLPQSAAAPPEEKAVGRPRHPWARRAHPRAAVDARWIRRRGASSTVELNPASPPTDPAAASPVPALDLPPASSPDPWVDSRALRPDPRPPRLDPRAPRPDLAGLHRRRRGRLLHRATVVAASSPPPVAIEEREESGREGHRRA